MREPHVNQPEHPCARPNGQVRSCYLCGKPYVYRHDSAPQASGYCSLACILAVDNWPSRRPDRPAA